MNPVDETPTSKDIRRLLKTFGVQADEAIQAYLQSHPGVEALQVRVVLEDRTDYGGDPPSQPLHLEVSGEVRNF